MSDTIPMVRDEPAYPGGPTSANVHPDEVANFVTRGWLRSDGKPAPAPVAETIETAPSAIQQLGDLRREAKALGIGVSPRHDAAKLRALIAEKQNG